MYIQRKYHCQLNENFQWNSVFGNTVYIRRKMPFGVPFVRSQVFSNVQPTPIKDEHIFTELHAQGSRFVRFLFLFQLQPIRLIFSLQDK